MSEQKKNETPTLTEKKSQEQLEKADRLAQALRANLRKRKGQSRARKTLLNPSPEQGDDE